MATFSIAMYQTTLTLSPEQLLGWTGGAVIYYPALNQIRLQFRNPATSLLPDSYDLLLTGTFTSVGGIVTGGTVSSISGQDTAGTELSSFNGLSINVTPLLVTGAPFALTSPNINSAMGNADTLTGSTLGDSLTGYGGADSILGKEGDDTLSGLNGMDTINGGDGKDIILGGFGNDSLTGGLGEDTISGEQDDDEIYGGIGDDVLNGQLGIDSLYGENGDDELNGGAGNDILYGGEGTDTLDGGTGSNALYGDEGDDLAFSTFGSSGVIQNADFYGGEGFDTLQIHTVAAPASVAFNLSASDLELIDFTSADGQTVTATATSQFFYFSNGMQIDGGSGTEKLIIDAYLDPFTNLGTTIDLRDLTFTNWQAGVDQIQLNGTYRNDLLIGSAQADTIIGGDIAVLGASNDVLDGGLGADSLSGGIGSDLFRYYNSPEDPFYSGSVANETINGGDDYDVISLRGNGTLDFSEADISYVESFDFVASSGGVVGAIFNGIQLDTFSINIYRIAGTSFEAALTLTIIGSYSDSTHLQFQFWDSNDRVIIPGTNAADNLIGTSQADLIGELSNDGDDDLEGFSGDDTLTGGTGGDTIDGGDGIDTASYASAAAGVQVVMYNTAYNTGDALGDTIVRIEILQGSALGDTLVGGFLADSLLGGAGDDWLDGTYGGDYIFGDVGNDNLVSRLQADELDGGADFDYARFDYADAGLRAYLYDTAQNSGWAAGDTFTSIEGIAGSYFADDLRGDASQNIIYGLGGGDFIIGLGGSDLLIGGDGQDLFHFLGIGDGGPYGDVIRDFVSGFDRISLTGAFFGLGSPGGVAINSSQFVAGTTATLGSSQFIFDAATGQLWYDQDGTGAGVQALLATLQAGATMAAGDILVL
jgi:Ca2+-binding RTX toxin-like protein